MILYYLVFRLTTSLYSLMRCSIVKSRIGSYINEFKWMFELAVMLTFSSVRIAGADGDNDVTL